MHRLASLGLLGVVLGAFAPACSSSSDTPDDTCGFVADTNNCYRQLLTAVDACLTDEGGDGGILSGKFSADGTSCTYPSGRAVTFVGDARQYDASKSAMDVTVALGGRTCVHYVAKPKSGISITGPDGRSLTVEVAGLVETITCPDGSKHGIDAQKLFAGCGDAGSVFGGGLPGTVTSGTGTSAIGSLVGMKKDAYSCTSP
jgi:hypothetical protein